jgi:anthranilate phosphoribosyltransferase
MLGPMSNPARPQNQLVGVFSLELARLYAYLYQNSDSNYTILHALEGYDEVSLTCNFKTFSNQGEKMNELSSLGFEKIDANTIKGGETVEDSAKIFVDVLDNKATTNQNNVVLCNAALAIQTINPDKSFADCFYEAEQALLSGAAKKSFAQLLEIR